MYKYFKIDKNDLIEKNGVVINYSESINGARTINNYLWILILFFFGIGFIFAGISSYLKINFFSSFTFSNINFIPQGILLIFYGTCSILLSFFSIILSYLNIGSGTNIYDVENKVIRISRKGFPTLNTKLNKNKNIYLVYSFSDVKNLELNICDGLNPTRILYLNLKDERKIPLTPSNELSELSLLEKRALFITKLLKVDLKLSKN